MMGVKNVNQSLTGMTGFDPDVVGFIYSDNAQDNMKAICSEELLDDKGALLKFRWS